VIVKKIKDLALKTHWINSRVNNGKKLYFNKIFLPNFLNYMNEHFGVSKYYDLNYAFAQSPVKGLINSIFDPTAEFFNALDLSVAINIAVNGFCNEKYVCNHRIIDSANFICETLKKNLYEDNILKEYLAEMDKKLQDFKYIVERSKIESVLSNKRMIFETYFQKYHNSNYSTGIIIYHQAEGKSWLEWDKENTITINHDTIKFREGFFLTGFDYKLISGNLLRIASVEDGYEYFNPKEFVWGENVVWAH
jgi:hypothetical protein